LLDFPFYSQRSSMSFYLVFSKCLLHFFCCYVFSENLLFLVAKPYLKVIPDATFLSIQLTESFTTYINSSVILALFYSVPILFYQVWSFIIPSCTESTRNLIWWYAIASGLLFLVILGICFLYILPIIWYFLAQCNNTSTNVFLIKLQPRISDYCLLTLKLCLLLSICSQIPLCFLYLINKAKLKACIQYRKLLWLSNILLGALVTPPEWQLLTSGCLVIFVELTLFLSYVKCEYTSALLGDLQLCPRS